MGIKYRNYSIVDDQIACDGDVLSASDILSRLRTLEVVREVLYESPELNELNYTHDQACRLNTAVCEALTLIDADANATEQFDNEDK